MSARVFQEGDLRYYLIRKKPKKGKAIYHARFLGDLDDEGRRAVVSQKSTRQTNEQAAHNQVRRWIADGKVGGSPTDLAVYLRNFWDLDVSAFLKERERTERPYSIAYLTDSWRVLERFCLPYFKEREILTINELNRKNISEWLQYLHTRGDVTPRVQNRCRQALFTALRYAATVEQIIPFHPGEGIKPTKEPISKRKPFSEKEMTTLLLETKWGDERARVACALAFDTGMRLGEVRGLTWECVDMDDGTVMVQNNWIDGEGLKPPKSGKVRGPLEISTYTLNGFQTLRRLVPSDASGTPFVFFNLDGSDIPCSDKMLTRGLKRACVKAGIDSEGKSFHSLRHTAISIWGPRMTPADRLTYFGHSDSHIQERYTHRTDESRKQLREHKDNILPFQKAK